MVELTDARIKELIRRYKPRGWKLAHEAKYEADYCGLANDETRTIHCPKLHDKGPNTTLRFLIFFHECGHVHLGHFQANMPRSLEEYEAERYSILTALAEGFKVNEAHVRSAQDNVHEAAGEDDQSHRTAPAAPIVRAWIALAWNQALCALVLS